MNKSKRHDDDIDDFMASIFGNETPAKKPAASPLFSRPHKPKMQEKQPPRQQRVLSPHPTVHVPKRVKAPKTPRPKRNLKISVGKPALGVVTAFLFIGLVFVLWQGPLQSVFYPSPFSDETKEKMSNTTLYFPTTLPKEYKIEKDTMKQPSSGVLVYAASNEAGNAITFSIQSKPSGLNTKPFTDQLTSTKTVQTSEGEATIGEDTDGKRIASYLTDTVWMIINANKDNVSTEELEALVKSLRKG